MTPTQPPAPAGATARERLMAAISPWVMASVDLERATDAILSALAEAGHLIASADDVELAVEWMDQTDNPWSGEMYRETWADSLVMRDQLRAALAAYHAARQPEGESDGK